MDIRSEQVRTAVQRIERRAERESNFRKLYDIYVDRGFLREISSTENQIIYGRRGVGKSHLLSYYRDHLLGSGENYQCQLHDCSRFGSGLASASSNPVNIATNMFAVFLNDTATVAFEYLDRLEKRDSRDRAGMAILAFQDVISKGGGANSAFDFRNLGDTLERYVEHSNCKTLILALDEWVAIPRDAQPYFAEFLKRTFFTKKNIAVKIATVTYQTTMSKDAGSGIIGLESGADVFSDVNLDNYFVWEEDKDGVQDFFAQALYNHVGEDLGWDLGKPAVDKIHEIQTFFFTQANAFVELCRAAEGNCRDFLNVFRLAYSQFLRDPTAQHIGVPHVNAAAEDWYRQDKLLNISGDQFLEDFLNYLIQDVIRGKKSKTFMVSYRDLNHPLLARLFSARLLHPLRTTWSHPDRPGEPYYLVTMDFGCYRALINTRAEPSQLVLFDGLPADHPEVTDLVPLDDRRSIRRIVLERSSLDRFSKQAGLSP